MPNNLATHLQFNNSFVWIFYILQFIDYIIPAFSLLPIMSDTFNIVLRIAHLKQCKVSKLESQKSTCVACCKKERNLHRHCFVFKEFFLVPSHLMWSINQQGFLPFRGWQYLSCYSFPHFSKCTSADFSETLGKSAVWTVWRSPQSTVTPLPETLSIWRRVSGEPTARRLRLWQQRRRRRLPQARRLEKDPSWSLRWTSWG